jgi:hypothetical protein
MLCFTNMAGCLPPGVSQKALLPPRCRDAGNGRSNSSMWKICFFVGCRAGVSPIPREARCVQSSGVEWRAILLADRPRHADRAALPPGLTPRLLSREQAAAYCGISPVHFSETIGRELPADKARRGALGCPRAGSLN